MKMIRIDCLIVYFFTMLSLQYAFRFKATLLGRPLRYFSTTGNENHQENAEIFVEKLQKHQSSVPKISLAEEVKTLISTSKGFGIISTNSQQYPGYPTGSLVAFQVDDDRLPFFSLSTMSAHTRDLAEDSKSSLVVTANNFQTLNDARATLIGQIVKVTDPSQITQLREKYLKLHPDSYWIDFG
jgi:hypothetical protein